MGRSAHPVAPFGADEEGMDIFSYYRTVVAPWIQARVARTERGASLVEYALLVALIAVVCIVAISFVGGEARDKFSEVGSKLN
jgi:pilus assembly protein Flp/PilA